MAQSFTGKKRIRKSFGRIPDLTHVSDKVLGVHDDFIAAAWRVVDSEYGGFDNYLAMIGVDAELLSRLRSRLLD